MTDPELFNSAVTWARFRQDWLHRAAGMPAGRERRRLLRHARRCEAHVVNLSITAEKRARRDQARGVAA
ncbi:MAG: hypothetical protein E6Q67_12825 [Roseateles sp.]|nr:MAG: hypothetical protein E6Q67_12825 [Roseateles sp.]